MVASFERHLKESHTQLASDYLGKAVRMKKKKSEFAVIQMTGLFVHVVVVVDGSFLYGISA